MGNENLAWNGVGGLHRSGVGDVYRGEEMYDTDQPIFLKRGKCT